MNRKLCILLYMVFLAACLSVSCKTAELGFKVMDINGMIYDFSNRPVPFYEISIGGRHKSTTDINGRFTLSKVPAGIYTITGYKKGFETCSEEVIIKDQGQIIYIRIPSQNQLLDMVDETLTANNYDLAGELAERAYQIDKNNIEMLFYYATIKFRQHEYDRAITFLETAKKFGSRDLYIDKFLTLLKEL